MIIGVDGNEANVDNRVGVSVYTLQLLRYFQKNSSKDKQFKVYLRRKPGNFMPEECEFFKYVAVAGPFAWSQIFLPAHLYLNRSIDIFFTPAHYAPRNCPVPLVVTIHDLSYFYYPDEFLKKDLYKLKSWTEYSVQKAVKVIAVSKTTKKDVMKFYHVPDNKIEVIYNGYEKSEDTDTKKDEKNSVDTNDYILYVGTIQPRKNISNLIKAFASFIKIYPTYKLVLVGKKGWLYEKIFDEIKSLNVSDSVIFTGYLSDSEVVTLYKKAFCFVLPSLYEGFGIPLLEAMAYEVPTLASYVSSLPEIGGEAVLYFDPKNPDEIADKMILLKKNESLREELVKKGKDRLGLFSWETCGKQTLEVLTNALNHETI